MASRKTDLPPDYSAYKQGPGDNVLTAIAGAALEQKRAEAEVARLEDELKAAQNKLRDIAERQLPELMDAAEMTTCETRDGIVVKIREKIRGSIPKGKEAPAFEWLGDHGHDKLIKRRVIIEFNREDAAWARKFEADMRRRKRPLNAKIEETIHPSTLSSFVTEQLQAGVDIPLTTFGVFRQRGAVITVRGESE